MDLGDAKESSEGLKAPGEALLYGPHIRRSNFAGDHTNSLSSALAIPLMLGSFVEGAGAVLRNSNDPC